MKEGSRPGILSLLPMLTIGPVQGFVHQWVLAAWPEPSPESGTPRGYSSVQSIRQPGKSPSPGWAPPCSCSSQPCYPGPAILTLLWLPPGTAGPSWPCSAATEIGEAGITAAPAVSPASGTCSQRPPATGPLLQASRTHPTGERISGATHWGRMDSGWGLEGKRRRRRVAIPTCLQLSLLWGHQDLGVYP